MRRFVSQPGQVDFSLLVRYGSSLGETPHYYFMNELKNYFLLTTVTHAFESHTGMQKNTRQILMHACLPREKEHVNHALKNNLPKLRLILFIAITEPVCFLVI